MRRNKNLGILNEPESGSESDTSSIPPQDTNANSPTLNSQSPKLFKTKLEILGEQTVESNTETSKTSLSKQQDDNSSSEMSNLPL